VETWVNQAAMKPLVGVIVPAYFSAKPSNELVSHLLRMTLGDCVGYVAIENTWVVVDGDARTAKLVGQLRNELRIELGTTFQVIALPENRGKFWATREGVAALLEANPEVQYIAIRDGDGDHDIAEVPSLTRAAMHLAQTYGHTRVVVIGSRRSRHHPMGMLRGELEAMLDQVTLDALAYRMAQQGRALDLCHCTSHSIAPDLSSGFKIYGREIAQKLFVDHEHQLACLSPTDYWHYGPETVAMVEALLMGAVIGEKLRLTWNGQPTTSFGEFNQIALYGELLAWVYARLNVPIDVAAQFYDNRVAPLMLHTAPRGSETIASLRQYALNRVADWYGANHDYAAPKALLPFM